MPRVERQKMIVLAVVGLFVIVAFAVALNLSTTFSRFYSDIFLRWYAATKLFSEGRNLYDPQNATEMWQIAFGQNPWGYETNFFYPAHLLVFVAPLALLPYQTAHLIWTIIIQLFYFIGLWLIIRHSGWPSKSTAIGIFMALNFISLPYIFHTIWGQFNTIGMLGLALCFLALCDGRYALAGALAVSLTFKPQNDLLVLLFLLFWSLWQKKRWPFILGFGVTSFFCWLFAELLQPGWVMAFMASLGHYTRVESAVDLLWNPGQVTAILLALGSLVVFFWKRHAAPGSLDFVVCLTLSLAVWDLVVPIYGWIQTVLLALAIVWLVPLWKRSFPVFGHSPVYGFAFLFVLGWIFFFLDFVFPGIGMLGCAEKTYKLLFPLFVAVISVPLLWKRGSNG